MTAGVRYPRHVRVRARADFDRIFASATRTASPMLAVHLLSEEGPPRLGLAVSRKVDKRAVGRNRIKRVLRDAFRLLQPQLKSGSYVVVARPAAAQADNEVLRAAFLNVLKRARALPPSSAVGTMPVSPIPSTPVSPGA
ncbi:MAG: ribonuclease P protein component [Luteimonas sp.]